MYELLFEAPTFKLYVPGAHRQTGERVKLSPLLTKHQSIQRQLLVDVSPPLSPDNRVRLSLRQHAASISRIVDNLRAVLYREERPVDRSFTLFSNFLSEIWLNI